MYHYEIKDITRSRPFYEKTGIITFINNANNVMKILRFEPIINLRENTSKDVAELYVREYKKLILKEIIHHNSILHSTIYVFKQYHKTRT